MMGSEWQAMDGAARQGKRKSKGGLWLWMTPREKKGSNPGTEAINKKNTRKQTKNEIDFPLTVFSKIWARWVKKNHKGADSNLKSIHFLVKTVIIKDFISYFVVKIAYFSIIKG